MKRQIVFYLCALLCACVLADYEFKNRDLGCDYTIEAVVESTDNSNTTTMIIYAHGNFRKITTSSVVEGGFIYITETIIRPDLASQEGYALEVMYATDAGISTSEQPIQITEGTSVFRFREPAIFNGHRCFKYYNVPSDILYADENGYIWGSQETNDDGVVSTITYKSYKTNEVPASQFTLSNGNLSSIITPDALKYSLECREINKSDIYYVLPPSLGCDLRMMIETDFFTGADISYTTQSTVWSHGTFMLQVNVDTSNWKTISSELTRPDQGEMKGMAAMYTYTFVVGSCIKAETMLSKVTFESYVFTHCDEEYYNGFMCYKYYNDSSFIYYVEKSQGLPRAVVIPEISITRFVYYDFTPINSSLFVFTGTELEACGVESGEKVNTTSYKDACGPLVLPNTSSKTETEESNIQLSLGFCLKNSAPVFMIIMMFIAFLS